MLIIIINIIAAAVVAAAAVAAIIIAIAISIISFKYTRCNTCKLHAIQFNAFGGLNDHILNFKLKFFFFASFDVRGKKTNSTPIRFYYKQQFP